jgi:hypothetical protein
MEASVRGEPPDRGLESLVHHVRFVHAIGVVESEEEWRLIERGRLLQEAFQAV